MPCFNAQNSHIPRKIDRVDRRISMEFEESHLNMYIALGVGYGKGQQQEDRKSTEGDQSCY
jgi:hypothetical protein